MRKLLVLLCFVSSAFVLANNADKIIPFIDQNNGAEEKIIDENEAIEKEAEEEELNKFDGFWIYEKLVDFELMDKKEICEIAEDENYLVTMEIVQSNLTVGDAAAVLINENEIEIAQSRIDELCEETIKELAEYCQANSGSKQCKNIDLTNKVVKPGSSLFLENNLEDLITNYEFNIESFDDDYLAVKLSATDIVCKQSDNSKVDGDVKSRENIFVRVSDIEVLNDLNRYIINNNCEEFDEELESSNIPPEDEPKQLEATGVRKKLSDRYDLNFNDLNIEQSNSLQCQGKR